MLDFFLNILEFVVKTFVLSGVGVLLMFLLKEKFKALIQYSIKYTFDKKLEDYKTKEIKRQKAILIADLLSEWISWPENRKKLNQLTLEAFIWLPKNMAEKLSQLLSDDKNKPQVREIVAEVRKLLLNDNDEVIDHNIIIIFTQKSENIENIESHGIK